MNTEQIEFGFVFYIHGFEARKIKLPSSDPFKVAKAFKDMQRFIQVLAESFEGLYGVTERVAGKFFEYFKSFR